MAKKKNIHLTIQNKKIEQQKRQIIKPGIYMSADMENGLVNELVHADVLGQMYLYTHIFALT